MTLTEFARNHPLLLNARFLKEEAETPPMIVGLVGGLLFRDDRTLNSVIYRMTPHYNDDVLERKELAKQYPNIQYRQKQAVDLFRAKGICYLDVNYMYIVNDYVQSRSEDELEYLSEEFAHLDFTPRKLQHEIETQYHGKQCPPECEDCASMTTVQEETKQQFVNDVIVDNILKPLFIDNKRFINERIILIVLPMRSEFAQHCDVILHVNDCEECKTQFVDVLPSDLHQAYLQQLEDLPNDFVEISIDNDDMRSAVDQIFEALEEV